MHFFIFFVDTLTARLDSRMKSEGPLNRLRINKENPSVFGGVPDLLQLRFVSFSSARPDA